MRSIVLILAALAVGCGHDLDDSSRCWADSPGYIKTEFVCFDYSVEHKLCASHEDSSDCVQAYDVPEAHLTHCRSYNYCE